MSAPRTGLFLFVMVAAAILGSTRVDAQNSWSAQRYAVTVGSRVVLAATADGSNPFTYQWRKDGADIAGERGFSLVLQNIQPADAGLYSVVVGNTAGLAVSAEVMLVVESADIPTIIQRPHSQAVNPGNSAAFQAFVSGAFPVTYAWHRNGVSIEGATNALLMLTDVQASDAGAYTVVVTNAAGSTTSVPAVLEVMPWATALDSPSQISNFAARASLAAGQTLAIGMTMNDGPARLLVRAAGPALNAFGVSETMADPRIDLYRADALLFSNDDWSSVLANDFAAVGAFGFPEGSKDAALVQDVDAETLVQVGGTGAGAVLVEAYLLDMAAAPGFRNLSVRHRIRTGDDILLVGFHVVGRAARPLLIRAVGPGLTAFGVPTALGNPKLEIYNSAGLRILQNDNWDSDVASVFATVGAFELPAGSRDAAVLVALGPGGYTVTVASADGGSGEVMLEIYEVR